MKTLRFVIALAALVMASFTVLAQKTEYVGIEPPLDGPSMVRYVFNPEHVASEMIDAWTSREDLSFERLKGLVRSLGMEILDTEREVNQDPEEGEPPVLLTVFGGGNCEMTRVEKPCEDPDSEDGETYEEIDFNSRDGVHPFSVIIINVLGYDDDSFNFSNNMESSLRVAYTEHDKRDAILSVLREITGFQYVEEEEIYAGYESGEIDYGTVITTTDDEETGLFWVEICSFL